MKSRLASKQTLLFTVLFVLLLCTAILALTPDDIRNMPVNSWLSVPNTKLRSVAASASQYPGVQGVEGVMGVHSYSGASLDTKRNRLIVFGGGHNAYYGNEVYAFAIDEMKWYRLTDPCPNPSVSGGGSDPNPDGTPNTRHTYNGLAYMTHADRFFVLGGALGAQSGGCGTTKTWTLNLASNQWENRNPSGTNPAPECEDMAAYDPTSKKVFWGQAHIGGGTARMGLYSYDFETNRWTQHNSNVGYSYCIGIVDTKRNLLVIVGNPPYVSVHVYDIKGGNFASATSWATTGGDAFISASSFKGLAYDPVADRYVGIDGGNRIWALNPDTKVWTSLTPSGSAPNQEHLAGIYGLWQYVPSVNAFIFQTHVDRDVTFYKFSAGSGTMTEKPAALKSSLRLEARPNPFKSSVTLKVTGAANGAQVLIYDLNGRMIAAPTSEENAGDIRKFIWKPHGVNSGIYLVKVRTQGASWSGKIFLEN